ncbi:MAG: hypothetical protein JST75_18135 [Bacteroidetes bacterium]|nr:hypothetical protein [Bacteroidota bacterium]
MIPVVYFLFWTLGSPTISMVELLHAVVDSSSVKSNSHSINTNLSGRFQCFAVNNNAAVYSITLCADVPDNNDPAHVNLGKEPGHVFIILSKTDTINGKSINQSFGFYPRRPASSLIFKNVRGVIFDNQCREYNASVYKRLNEDEFRLILEKSETLSRKKYNLNKYNCYDYAIGVFNAIPQIEKLPVTHVKFPFILGHGGSPCGLYKDLKRLKENNSQWAPYIRLGIFQSPENCSN